MMTTKGIYLHIPFCLHKCPYCDFCSSVSDEKTREQYVEKLCNAIKTAPRIFGADTLYMGGGTPTSLNNEQIKRIFDTVNQKFGPFIESTIEANPGTLPFVNPGFNRISFGVQSLDEQVLKNLGRIHSSKQALDAIKWAKGNGFKHISADLMLCVPGQNIDSVKRDIDVLCNSGIDHISTYMLQIEEGTKFFNTVKEPSEEEYEEFYLTSIAEIEKHGFKQYEISNFALNEDAKSKHNLHYWHDEEYLGIGYSAHSFIDGKRFYFDHDLSWDKTIFESDGGDQEEKIMLGLRLTEGIDINLLPKERMEKAIKNGYGMINHNRFAFTPKGFLISNALIADFLCD